MAVRGTWNFIFSDKTWMQPSLSWITRRIFTANGYQWEPRRSGEIKLGYWKKSLRSKDQRKSYPKRFVLIPGFGDSPLSWYSTISLLTPVLKGRYDEILLFDFP